MKAKRLLSMLLVIVAALGLMVGCGSATESQNDAGATTQTDTGAADDTQDVQDPVNESTGSGNVLVVYYSATGNTQEAANLISEATGGDLFELEPVQPYTDDDLDWTDDNSRVTREHEDESLRDVELVSTTVENWDSYDTVFIGYPKIQYGFLSV